MINIEKTHTCKSYWKNTELYDMEKHKSKRVKIFGVTVYQDKDDFKCDLIQVNGNEGMGFKKGEH